MEYIEEQSLIVVKEISTRRKCLDMDWIDLESSYCMHSFMLLVVSKL